MFGHPQGNLSSLFDRNYKGSNIIFFENFEIFSDWFSIAIWYPNVLIPFIWRKPVSCRRVTLPAERKKKHWPQPAFAYALIVRALAMRALYRYGSDLPVGPKCPLPFYKIIFCRTTDLYPAYKHDNQTRGGFGLVSATGMYLPLGTWFFRNFKQEFLFNGKRVKCLQRNVGPARRLTLPLQKGDWTKWVTLLAKPTFCNLNGSPCSVKKCVKRCLFQEPRVGGWPFCSRQIFFI